MSVAHVVTWPSWEARIRGELPSLFYRYKTWIIWWLVWQVATQKFMTHFIRQVHYSSTVEKKFSNFSMTIVSNITKWCYSILYSEDSEEWINSSDQSASSNSSEKLHIFIQMPLYRVTVNNVHVFCIFKFNMTKFPDRMWSTTHICINTWS